jgi:septal ring factor EnvC (AmiA/AmiB activator)
METSILVSIVALLAAPVGAFVTWVLHRRKSVADIYNTISESSQNAVEAMNTALEALRNELDEAHKKIDTIMQENKQLHQDIMEVKEQNKKLLAENVKLKKQLTQFNSTVKKLVVQNDSSTQIIEDPQES